MELRQLRYFVAIVEHGSMTKAADSLHVAQPALSQQIANLEGEFDGRFFERSSHGMKTTPSGDALFRYARNILRQIDEMRVAIGHETASPSGRVSIGIPGSTAKAFSAPLLRELSRYPKITVELVERPSAELVALTAQGAVDMAIAVDAQPNRGVTLTRLFREQLYAVLPYRPGNHTGERKADSIGLAAFAANKLLLPKAPNTIRSRLETALLDAGLPYQLVAEVNTTDLMVGLVAAGIGCAVLPWSAVAKEERNREISVLPFQDVNLSRELSLCLPSGLERSPAGLIVEEILVDNLSRAVAAPTWLGVERLASLRTPGRRAHRQDGHSSA